ncbi:probable aminoacyl tRNA synthase complex-interacting multifunctional protein 2 isoform X2 [Linepithema humile]|uniref:probable aminoacyl tRNA synthase complex-interacting multifunctional protein 2 isoform X2 n=1 Tax=Linepithema humile TaxID=83485 RepID=UPI0006232458|nr:PREDICTED: probable aminoacyl tRNA synthase complex-interacting multifunctional protein 2 isoform X2 [Linepithema humile]
MYTLRPINVLPPCPPSKVMYQLPNILTDKHDGSRIETDIDTKMPDDVVTEQKPLRDYSALEARQEKVLDQLAKLKNHVQTLCHFLKQSDRLDGTKIGAALPESTRQLQFDLIVYANPRRPPFSILALQKRWENTVFKLQSFVHSTVEGPVPVFLPNNSDLVANNIVNLKLIWKKVDQLEFVKDLSSHPISGEVNLLRYLSRKITGRKFYDQNVGLHDNHILDLCYRLSETDKFIGSIISELNELENLVCDSEVLKGCMPHIADIAVWTTVKHLFPSSPLNKLPKSIREVYKVCEEMFIDNDLVHTNN